MINNLKISIVIVSALMSWNSMAQTNATDASPVDCSGTTHNLFSELDAGKIIVIGWAMPCASCAGPLLNVHNWILNYEISNPGIVEYWLADDFANTNCASFTGWCSTNGLTNATYFSSAELSMVDYGSPGMPKVVVLGCIDHRVYYNVINSPTGAGVAGAIDQALVDMAASCQLGTGELVASKFSLNCFPNPANESITVSFKMSEIENASLELLDLNGDVLKHVPIEKSNAGLEKLMIDVHEYYSGFYFLQLNNAGETETIKIQVIN